MTENAHGDNQANEACAAPRLDVMTVAQLRAWRADIENAEPWQRAQVALADAEFGEWWVTSRDRHFSRSLEALDAFIAREGHGRVPQSHDEDGHALGARVSQFRGSYHYGSMGGLRIRELESRPEWRWSQFSRSDYLNALDTFIEREGHSWVARVHVEGFVGLGGWVARAREDYEASNIDRDLSEQLESRTSWEWVGMPQKTGPRVRSDWLAVLDSFIAENGHANVPKSYVEGPVQLGRWVGIMRTKYRKGELSPAVSSELASRPSWVWERLDWLRALDSYVQREGNASVPKMHIEDGIQLGRWVGATRRGFSNGSLSDKLIAQLDSRDYWVWPEGKADATKKPVAPRRPSFSSPLPALDRYMLREGHSIVPLLWMEGNIELGKWVQRQRLLRDTLTSSMIASLESRAIWVWDSTAPPRRRA
jgi:hypothetical protein